MTWRVVYRCSDCETEESSEQMNSWEWRGYVPVCPVTWTAFSSGHGYYESLYCPECSEKLAEEGRAYLAELEQSRLSRFLRRFFDRGSL